MKKLIARFNAWVSWPNYWNARAKCFLFGHEWRRGSYFCDRCAASESKYRNGNWPLTLPEHIAKWRAQFKRTAHAEDRLPPGLRSVFGRLFGSR